MYEEEINRLVDSFKSLNPNQLQENNALDRKKTERQYEEFLGEFKKGVCYLCGGDLDDLSSSNICLHWLLIPKSFKKKNFPEIYTKFDYFQIMSYVRWVASTGGFFTNINDLVEEHSGNNMIDCSINYNNIKWSFSCSVSDFEGHPSSKAGKMPHYHLQIRIDDKIFMKYNDFHVPFKKKDIISLKLMQDFPDEFKGTFGPGEGMRYLFDSENVHELAMDSTPVLDESNSTFNIQTLIMAKPGEFISGDEVNKLIEECKQENVTLASMAHKLGGNRTTIVSPGDGIPKPKQRRGRKRKKNRRK